MASELFPENNPASINAEGTDLSGTPGESGPTMSAGTTDPYNGTYTIKCEATAAWQGFWVQFTGIAGHRYRITFYHKVPLAYYQQIVYWENFDEATYAINLTDTTWTQTTFDLTCTADGLCKILLSVTRGIFAGDDTLEIDAGTIEDLDAPATTTVEVKWIDSISAAATGNKIYRDDVEIADIANGIQFYSDPDAPAGTESKYEVQAHDGAGDETTQEVLGVNVQYITTA